MDAGIFERVEDYLDWTKLIRHCAVLEGLTTTEKEQAKRAFQFLRQEFGEDFLSAEPRHPLVRIIIDWAAWTRKWIIWLAEAIQEFQDLENYPALLAHLKNKEKYAEAISVLEIAYKCAKTGFGITIEPEIAGWKKVPDLKLLDLATGEELFVEISILGESYKAREASQTLHSVFEPLWHSVPFVQYSGRIGKALAERHLSEITSRVQEAVEKSAKEKIFQEVNEPDALELGIATENAIQRLEKWATERNLLLGEITGPAYDVDEIARIDQKFKYEQEQLPRDRPNIVIVRNNDVFVHSRDMGSTISRLEETVYRYPHLLLGVIAGGHRNTAQPDTIMKGQHAFIRRIKADVLVEEYIVLLNRFRDCQVSESTITKLYAVFGEY